ncbi:hypothetical protein RJ639_039899 [Escallonia herrerae]|uniref:Acid phosphatase n=1 Tax=Escallonia herrerae TaxID=1293975 RepID=A0AA89B5R7_9ASTE|nr:hypothetical protein RJ639_039899 [Escallonia herrerae]
MKVVLFSLLVTTLLATHSHAASPSDQVHLLRPQSGAAGKHIHGVNCLSWRLAVETNSLQKWTLVPEACEQYVGHYMLGRQYRDDCNAVGEAAAEYAKSLKLAGDGKDIWVFDIDETTLSNLPYYARTDVAFGAMAYNGTKFNEWVATGKAPAVPGALKLYKKLVLLGFKIVFLSGTLKTYREVRITNLKEAGYHTWEKLILKQVGDKGTAVAYKSAKRGELEKAGYRILGNMGDQWSDLLGTHVGNRTFKVPDPMYYIS